MIKTCRLYVFCFIDAFLQFLDLVLPTRLEMDVHSSFCCVNFAGGVLLLILSSDAAEGIWIWDNEGEDYYFDKGEWVRVRVEAEQWHDLSPVAPAEREAVASMGQRNPYNITVSRTTFEMLIKT